MGVRHAAGVPPVTRLAVSWLAVACMALSGCAFLAHPSDPGALPPPDSRYLAAPTVGGFSAFTHGGGPVHLESSQGAQVALFGADDVRLGTFQLGGTGHAASVDLGGIPAGELVLHVASANGTVRVASDGHRVEGFLPLPLDVERHVLVPDRGDVIGPLVPEVPGLPPGAVGGGVEAALNLTLHHAPLGLRLLATGAYEGLAVQLSSGLGLILEGGGSDGGRGPLAGPAGLGGGAFHDVPARLEESAIRDRLVHATIVADRLDGALVLEATTYARSRPLADAAKPSSSEDRYAYGLLPAGPQGFEVPAGATRIRLSHIVPAASAGRAPSPGAPLAPVAVMLFDALDHPVARWDLAFGETRTLPVQSHGSFVAIASRGNAVLLALDALPGDLALHALAVDQQELPSRSAGGAYELRDENVTLRGTVYRVAANQSSTLGFPPTLGCNDPGFLRLLQGTEALGVWDPQGAPPAAAADAGAAQVWANATMRLGVGLLHVQSDGFGDDGCPRDVVTLMAYQRPRDT